MESMGMLRITIGIENPGARGRVAQIENVLVDTGSEFTWIPAHVLSDVAIQPERTQRFRLADGSVVERDIGFAIVHAAGTSGVDLVVFGRDTDATLIGAHCLEGLNLRIDPLRKQLVDAGPILTAVA